MKTRFDDIVQSGTKTRYDLILRRTFPDGDIEETVFFSCWIYENMLRFIEANNVKNEETSSPFCKEEFFINAFPASSYEEVVSTFVHPIESMPYWRKVSVPSYGEEVDISLDTADAEKVKEVAKEEKKKGLQRVMERISVRVPDRALLLTPITYI
jgi:hypothetical protein